MAFHYSSPPIAKSGSGMSLLLLLTAAACVLLPTAVAADSSSPRILDLSQDFPIGNIDNTDAASLEKYLTRDIRRFLVIDDGEIVMDYQRDTVKDDDIYNLWSATKATMTMIIGSIISSDEYDLSVDDTLGDIFSEESDWREVIDPEELEFKKNITIFELLTMTSGLTFGFESLTDGFSPNPLYPIDFPNAVGINLEESLGTPTYDATLKGTFNYLMCSNILSYVIREVTGMTPMEYVSLDLFPSLGIDVDKIKWNKNLQGVETSLSGLQMTAKDMAKIAQLYLQKGKSAPDKQVVSEEFVNESLTPRDVIMQGEPAICGYVWWYMEFNKTTLPNSIGDGVWCGSGFMGQGFCFNYESKRVIAYQRSNTVYNIGNWFKIMEFGLSAYDRELTWDIPIEVEESGAISISVMMRGAVAMPLLFASLVALF